jgi:hypothetical protein
MDYECHFTPEGSEPWHEFCLIGIRVGIGLINGKGGKTYEKILYYYYHSFSPVVVLSGAGLSHRGPFLSPCAFTS